MTLIEFVSGTKAKASEVNQNFETLQDGIDALSNDFDTFVKKDGSTPFQNAQKYATHVISGASYSTPITITSVGHGRSNGDKVKIEDILGNINANGTWIIANKTANTYELTDSIGSGTYTSGGIGYFIPQAQEDLASIGYVDGKINTDKPFSILSGNTDSNGDPDLLSYTGGTLSFKVDDGTAYAPLVATPANSQPTFTRTSIPSLNMSGYTNGTYNIFAGATGNAEGYIKSIYRQDSLPGTIPIMTSNSAPIGTCTGNFSDANYYKGFLTEGTVMNNYYSTTGARFIKYQYDASRYPVAGSKKFSFWAYRQSNVTVSASSVTITYNDDTTYTIPVAINITEVRNTFTADFIATKPIKAITISITASATSTNYTMSVGGAQIYEVKTGNIWLDTSVEPLKALKYSGSAWEEFNLVPIGSTTVASGVITAVENFPFNQNGYDVNMQSWGEPNVVHDVKNRPAVVVDTYINGTEWYRIWSDGWIEQGGYGSTSVTLLKPYSNISYSVQITSTYTGSGGFVMTCYDKTTSNFKIYRSWYSSGEANGYGFWRACGY